MNPSPINRNISNMGFCSHFSFSRCPCLFPAPPFSYILVTPRLLDCSFARVSVDATRAFFACHKVNIKEKPKQARNHFNRKIIPVEGSSKSRLLKATSSFLESLLYLAVKRHPSEIIDSINPKRLRFLDLK